MNPYRQSSTAARIGGATVVVPYRCAAEWVSALTQTGPGGVLVPLLPRAQADKLLDLLADNGLTSRDLENASWEFMGDAIPGFKWWESFRLLTVATRRDAAGALTLAGIDLRSITASQLCCAVYTRCTEGKSDTELGRFEYELSNPPPGVEDDGWGEMTLEEMAALARNMPGMR